MGARGRSLILALTVHSAMFAPGISHGQAAGKHACFTAHEQAQLLRKDAKLRAARAELFTCARDVCPAPLRSECAHWLGEIDAAQPTLVVQAHDAAGRDRADVRVLVDGEQIVDHLDGRPFAVDPGAHVVRFVSADGDSEEQSIVIGESEKDRRLSVQLAAPTPSDPRAPPLAPSADPKPPGRPTLAYVLTGVGIVGLASFGYFAASGYHQEKNLASTCAPTCATSDVDAVHRRYVIADLSLLGGAVALAAGGWLFLSAPRAGHRGVQVGPSIGWGGAGVVGEF